MRAYTTIKMRVLRVLTRLVAKLLLPAENAIVVVELANDNGYANYKYAQRRITPITLFGHVLHDDDSQVAAAMIRAKALSLQIDKVTIRENNYKQHMSLIKTVAEVLVRHDCARVVTQMLKNGYRPTKILSWRAAQYGAKNLLKVLEDNGQPIHEALCDAAARTLSLDMLKWLRSRNHAWGTDTVIEAAQSDAVEILTYLKANGCPWPPDGRAISESLKYDAVDAALWQIENACPVPEDICEELYQFDTPESQQLLCAVQRRGCCTCGGVYHIEEEKD